MNRTIWWVVLIVAAGAILAALDHRSHQSSLRAVPPAAQAPAPKPAPEPAIRYPIEEKPQEKPLPALNQSDPTVKDALRGLWNEKTLAQYFNLDGFVRRIVATIDNLARPKAAQRLMPVKPVPGQFRVNAQGSEITVSPENAKRYASYIKPFESVDTARLVDVYVHFYPLLQQAYEELGYPNAYFNDRLIEVIDHLLAAPEMPPNAKLVQPKVLYQFADPDLERRSAGQKIMMRMGNENAGRVKAKLQEIRNELTRRRPKSQ